MNHAPPGVAAAIIGYALGLTVVIVGYLRWRRRAAPAAQRTPMAGRP